MARKPRDTKAEYQARKARLAARGETLYQRRNKAAQRVGYASLADQRARRKAGDLTHADTAAHAQREGGKYVANIGGGRWTFATGTNRDGLTEMDRARLQATMDRAYNAGVNVTITATWRHENGRTGTAQAGGSYGVNVQRFYAPGDDAADAIDGELQASAGSELPAGAITTSLALFFFPAGEMEAA